jgi:glutamate--cysteine ligase catalytic subunit
VFRDKHTPSPYVETFLYNGPGEGAQAAKPDHVYLDAMGFGMGCCCLQV